MLQTNVEKVTFLPSTCPHSSIMTHQKHVFTIFSVKSFIDMSVNLPDLCVRGYITVRSCLDVQNKCLTQSKPPLAAT